MWLSGPARKPWSSGSDKRLADEFSLWKILYFRNIKKISIVHCGEFGPKMVPGKNADGENADSKYADDKYANR